MASITVTIAGEAGGPVDPPLSVEVPISATDADRLLAHVVETYGIGPSGVTLTTEQAIEAVVRRFADQLMGQVVRAERRTAARAASDAVAEIPITISRG